MSYYRHHVFFCQNARDNGEAACAQHDAAAALGHCKKRVKAEGLNGPGGVRINQAGCLDRCAGGPVIVVYPEAIWYTYVDHHDLDEIVDEHLKHGRVVERLVLPADIGR
jgi:(2Fe-2S) ferredoxin